MFCRPNIWAHGKKQPTISGNGLFKASKRRLHPEKSFPYRRPSRPTGSHWLCVGDQAHGITDLCLVELTESVIYPCRRSHFVRFGRAWRTAEMTDGTVVAAPTCRLSRAVTLRKASDLSAPAHQPPPASSRLPPLKRGKPMNFTARVKIAHHSCQRKKARPPPHGEMSHIKRRAVGAHDAEQNYWQSWQPSACARSARTTRVYGQKAPRKKRWPYLSSRRRAHYLLGQCAA